MFCIRCGTSLPEGAAFCPSCGSPATARPDEPTQGPVPPATAAQAPGAPPVPVYSGFWRRVWAYLLDRFLLGILFTPISLAVFSSVVGRWSPHWDDSYAAYQIPEFVNAIFTLVFIVMLGNWLYYALMQSSAKQATLGQMALEIRVTDLLGRRISFSRATGRYFASILTGLTLFIGYLVMLFTQRRQTLHDLIAGTVVVR